MTTDFRLPASLLGGTITVDRQVGRRRAFIVELPFGDARAPLAAARDRPPPSATPAGNTAAAGPGLAVLVGRPLERPA